MGRERRSAVVSTRPPGDRRSPWRCGYFRSYPPPTSVAFSASHRPTSTSCYTGSAPVCAAVSNRPSTLPTPAPSPLARSRGLDVTPCKKPAPPVPHAVRTHGLSRNLERPHQRVGGRRQGFRYDTTRCYRPGDAPRRCWAVRPGGADTRPAAPRRRLRRHPMSGENDGTRLGGSDSCVYGSDSGETLTPPVRGGQSRAATHRLLPEHPL